jgi:cytochrome c-type biogenesis protein CcmH
MRGLIKYLLVFCLVIGGVAQAAEAQPLAQDPVVEKRLNSISENLRCLVCQNESLAGSRADLAEDLRREVRYLIESGKSDQEVIDYLVSRYGDYVLYDPPFKSTTVLLWVGPFVLLGGGLIGLILFLRRRNREGLPDDEVIPTQDQPENRPLTRPDKSSSGSGRWLVWMIMILIPLGGVMSYLKVGNLAALDPANLKPAPDPNVMVARLQQKMDANPDDPAGWQLLARAYMVLNRPDDAVKSFQHILPLIKQEPQLMADYAEALAASGDLKGARTWINNALKMGSQDPKVLFLAGGLAFDGGNYTLAIQYWQRVLKIVGPESQEGKFIQENIQAAQDRIR